MKQFVIISALILFILVLLITSAGYVMATVHPFHPGNAFFPLQSFVELNRVLLTSNRTTQANLYLDLLERRIEDLSEVTGTDNEHAATVAVEEALDRSIDAIATAPVEDLPHLKSRMAGLRDELEATLRLLKILPVQSPQMIEELQAKINTLYSMLGVNAVAIEPEDLPRSEEEEIEIREQTPTPQIDEQGAIDPQTVEFPPGSTGAEHKFFPLSGKHATISCQDCHSEGQYSGTPNLCLDCHTDENPDPHFEWECSLCHFSTTWNEVELDHTIELASDCSICHQIDSPPGHYPGVCSICHNTESWQPANFDHGSLDVSNCQTCHSQDRPSNHYNGQCSACHNTRGWYPYDFDHAVARATDCQACHNKNKPANHFSGQCSACHSTRGWKPANFDHQKVGATDCQSCHANKRPANHFRSPDDSTNPQAPMMGPVLASGKPR